MKLSTKSRYALRIILQMALDNISGRQLSQGRQIAEKQGITEPYLEQIMIPLKRGGIVGTVRGCNGGYELLKPPQEISVLEIIELFEGRIVLADCNINRKNGCKRIPICPTTAVWEELSSSFREKAASFTLDTIIERYRNEVVPEYVI